jgi:hypothetical protein
MRIPHPKSFPLKRKRVREQAYRALGDMAEAAASFWEAYLLEPGSTEAHDAFNKCVFDAKQAQGLHAGGLRSPAEQGEGELKEWAASRLKS